MRSVLEFLSEFNLLYIMPQNNKPSSHHHNKKDLAGEHPKGDLGQGIFLVMFLVVWILDSFIFHFSTGLTGSIPFYFNLIFMIGFFTIAYIFIVKGLKIVFVEVRDPPRVIKTGVFLLTRHPVYLGSIFIYLGLILMTLSLISLALLGVIFIFYNYIASYEEQLLINMFGQDYLDYKKKVPKWFILLRSANFEK